MVNARGHLEGIVEEADATDRQKEIPLINSGIYCVRKPVLEATLKQVQADNAQQEFYLTDIVGIGHRQGLQLGVEIGNDAREVMGINTRAELERAEALLSG
jgi:bifunctional N-acetylglucosamine-1-phosphate-uridyltransferase/glucosamine-1-phosphate-acetyltransferase GlmU-like protein